MDPAKDKNVEQPPPAVLINLGALGSLRESIDFTTSRKEAKKPQVHQVFTENRKPETENYSLIPCLDKSSNDY